MEAARLGMGLTLTYALHELTLQLAMQAALREELMTLQPPLTYPPGRNRISTSTLRELDRLPLLNAVIMETLRARNPFLFPFRRIAPEGGASIDGYFITMTYNTTSEINAQIRGKDNRKGYRINLVR
jgi:hypothetical protein